MYNKGSPNTSISGNVLNTMRIKESIANCPFSFLNEINCYTQHTVSILFTFFKVNEFFLEIGISHNLSVG